MANVFTRRAIAFLIAVALAALAAFGVYNYVQGVEQEYEEQADRVRGYVATERIEPGVLADTAIQSGAIEEREIPRDLLAPNAVTDLVQITNRAVQEVILPGDQIVESRFAAPGQAADVLAIPPDHQAMSVFVNVPAGVGGFIREGDFVSVVGYLEVPDGTADTPGTGGTAADGTARRAQYLLQDVEVLAVGRRVEPSDEDPDGGTQQDTSGILLTVAVLPEEAEQLAFGTLDGDLWVTLLPEDQREPVDTPGRTADTIFEG